MLKFKDNGIFVKLEYILPKYHHSAIWVDFAMYKNEPTISFQVLMDTLRSYALVYGDCAIKHVDIKLSKDGIVDEEHSSYGYDFGTFVELMSVNEEKFKLFVEKCIFELIKPLEYQWFEKPKEKRKKYKRKQISGTLRQNVFDRDDSTCQICGANRYRDNVKIEVDHIIPVSKGGTNDIYNLQTLCQRCNREKHNRTDLKHDKRKLKELKKRYKNERNNRH